MIKKNAPFTTAKNGNSPGKNGTNLCGSHSSEANVQILRAAHLLQEALLRPPLQGGASSELDGCMRKGPCHRVVTVLSQSPSASQNLSVLTPSTARPPRHIQQV